ncbi:uncharacterized protein LOC135640757 [Musa acuminata AAA Group]|uniref:uncharacterized protein LOC135640757 n=1 Tax=Musa acuminata AAA Group TaxID=214697 RepID=UPI0031E44092
MPPSEGRGRNLCIWFISCLFFLVLLAGGAFLVLYITLPETKDTAWFPIAGMTLVTVPWMFWFTTCIYRFVATGKEGGARPVPTRAASMSPSGGGAAATGAAATATVDSPVNSPGDARRVRFGNATVMGTQNDADGDGGPAGASGPPPGEEAEEDSDATLASSDGSSLNSHESEVPLAFSMS